MPEVPHGEASEGDALDQRREVGSHDVVRPLSADPEVPEADALEQALEVPPDDD